MSTSPVFRSDPTERFRDLVPQELRAQWKSVGFYPNSDLFEQFTRQVERAPDTEAVIDDGGPVSYTELHDLALRLAAGLLSLGVRAGDVVAHQLVNSRWCSIVDLGVAAVGATVLPFPPGRGYRDAYSVLHRSEAVVVIIEDEYADVDLVEVYRELRASLPALRHVVVNGKQEQALDAISLSSLVSGGPLTRDQRPHVNPDSIARILISSGSESEPKLVAYSHNALFGGRGRYLEKVRVAGHPLRILILIPLASSWGSMGAISLAWMGGTIIVRRKFTVDGTWDAIENDQPTNLFAVPTMLHRLLASPRIRGADTSSLKVIHSGGAPLDPASADRCHAEFGATLLTGYGSADGMMCSNEIDDPIELQRDTVGRPDPRICSIRIVDEHGDNVPEGTQGEIYGRGPFSPNCYVAATDLDTKYRTADGWVRSGDRGFIDADGRLRLVGRQREMIIRGGKNISPAEVEAIVAEHPDVVGVACVAVPDTDLGQRVGVCLTQRHGSMELTQPALAQFLAARGAETVKFPDDVAVLDELPLSPAGKVDKARLAEVLTAIRSERTRRTGVSTT